MKKRIYAVLLSSLFANAAFAGGYQLSEYSVTNLGRAFAGAGIVGDDYSAIAFNPAGMVLKSDGVQAGANLVAIHALGKGFLRNASDESPIPSSAPKGKIHTLALLPHLFAQKEVHPRLTLGAGFYVPFGLGTYYNKHWYGATHALNSEINAMDFAVSGAFKVTEKVSLGGSVFAEYVDARLTNQTGATKSDLNADGWKPGYNVGILYQPWTDTRLGITYRSKVAHRIKGPHYFHIYGTTGDCSTKLVFPEHILLSAYQKVNNWGFSASARWTRWSRFDTLRIKSDALSQATGGAQRYLPAVEEKWRNVWMISGGVDYEITPEWTVRGGIAWDQGAVKDKLHRTARVPDSNRWIASLGGSYIYDRWQFDVSYAHMFLKTAKSYNRNGTTILDAKYSMGINLVGASVQYHF